MRVAPSQVIGDAGAGMGTPAQGGEPIGVEAVGPTVEVEPRGDALWVRLARPEAMNALDLSVLEGIEKALERSLAERARCVVITGIGRAFCAGADLKFVRGAMAEPDTLRAFLERAGSTFRKVELHPVPVIAAVNGLALAGGLELALACDVIVARAGASLGDGHATFGLFPGAGGAVRLPRRIGSARAKLLLLSGRSLPAADLEAWGLVDLVAPDDGLDATVTALVEDIVSRSPVGLRRMKQVVLEQEGLPVDRGLRLELDACQLHLRSEDVAEGLAAFVEHRRPQFTGR